VINVIVTGDVIAIGTEIKITDVIETIGTGVTIRMTGATATMVITSIRWLLIKVTRQV